MPLSGSEFPRLGWQAGSRPDVANWQQMDHDILAIIEDLGLHEFVRDPPARPPPAHATRQVTGWMDEVIFDDGDFISEDQDAA